MEEAKQKIYRPWLSGPPTYQQTTYIESRDVTQNRDWNYSLSTVSRQDHFVG